MFTERILTGSLNTIHIKHFNQAAIVLIFCGSNFIIWYSICLCFRGVQTTILNEGITMCLKFN